MTGTYTGNLNLYNPSLAEVGWKDEWDSNFQILDTSIGTYLNADGSFKAATAAAIPFFASGFSATNVYDAIVEAAAGGVPTVWGGITGSIINQTDLQLVLDGKVDENIAIVGSTQTKITYDSKGLVTSGSAATTADIADSLNARYVTDAQLSVLNTTSGTNTGDGAVTYSLRTGEATLTVNENVVFASGGGFTLTLPPAATATKMLCIKKIDSSMDVITIDGKDSETIDGQLTYLLEAQYMYVNIVSNGSNWLIIGNN